MPSLSPPTILVKRLNSVRCPTDGPSLSGWFGIWLSQMYQPNVQASWLASLLVGILHVLVSNWLAQSVLATLLSNPWGLGSTGGCP